MKKALKVATIVLMIVMMLTISTNVLAVATTSTKPGEMLGSADVDTQGITDIGNKVITIITTIGIVVSVIVLVVLGIKYMMGSAEEKAEYKKTLMPYVIGAGLVFAASSIAQIVYSFMEKV